MPHDTRAVVTRWGVQTDVRVGLVRFIRLTIAFECSMNSCSARATDPLLNQLVSKSTGDAGEDACLRWRDVDDVGGRLGRLFVSGIRLEEEVGRGAERGDAHAERYVGGEVQVAHAVEARFR